MKINIVPYEAHHVFSILEKGVRDFDLMLSRIGDWENAAKMWEKGGPGYTIFIDNEIVCSGGISFFAPGIGDCWILVTKCDKGMIIYKNAKQLFHKIIKEFKPRRLQSAVLPDFQKAIRFVEKMGFEAEGTLRKYGPNGEDLIMYSRIF